MSREPYCHVAMPAARWAVSFTLGDLRRPSHPTRVTWAANIPTTSPTVMLRFGFGISWVERPSLCQEPERAGEDDPRLAGGAEVALQHPMKVRRAPRTRASHRRPANPQGGAYGLEGANQPEPFPTTPVAGFVPVRLMGRTQIRGSAAAGRLRDGPHGREKRDQSVFEVFLLCTK